MYSALVPVRSLTKFVVGASVGRVVSQLIKQNVVAVSRTQKIRRIIAASAISGMAADAASKYAEREFDDLVRQVEKLKNQIKDAKEEKPKMEIKKDIDVSKDERRSPEAKDVVVEEDLPQEG